ncbi:Helicase conserved C-terminal domain [Frankia canadensis]|uniref:Helicase conserved C-terminal domain n=1 Tax=Frankia canadensis TaxID=1836972 RepID=A0A2I2KPG1_9ACTN|nr:helicase-associated domain-containing protein [Frankia canadensis]SNQ47546.1 Helicase conserved C-terminal domain [Frankia canadensis]SOU54836.1 Helicase conserved C-terminal domain [Frankia canadensis]
MRMSIPADDEVRDEPVTLAGWLRARPDDALVRLFLLRPDLATPPPPDFDILAARLEVRVSVARAMERLDTGACEVLEALTLLPGGVSLDRLATLCGVDGEAVAGLAAVVDRLRELGLVWGDGDGLRVVGMVVDLVGSRPLGLGRPVRECLGAYRQNQLARIAGVLGEPVAARAELIETLGRRFDDPAAVRGWLDDCSPRARALLDRLAAGPALGTSAEAGRVPVLAGARGPVEELLARGLVIGIDEETVELPREVGLAARGERPAGPLHPRPPALTGTEIGVPAADGAAALAAGTVVRWVATILDAWGAAPVTPLRTGGLSVRDLRAAARLLDTDERTAAFVVELAAAAGLVDATAGVDVQYMPTATYDRWGTELVPARWAALVEGWLRAPVASWLVGERDERGRQIAAMSLDVRRPAAVEVRAEVLRALAAAPPGVAPDDASLRALLAWRSPRRSGSLLAAMIDGTLAEAELLGLIGRGAPTTVGRLLAARLEAERADPARLAGSPSRPSGGDAALCAQLADALAPLLPAPVEELLLQADLTAVAPGPLTPTAAARVARMADVESTGAATVYRFSEDSLRRALDSGLTAEEIHAELDRLARTGVPQGLSYLIDDTARRHGRLRAGPAASYLRCDDTALLAEVVASRRTQALGLRRIAPTIVISPLPTAEVLVGLRDAGYSPVAEAADGRVLLSRPTVHRTPARSRPASNDVADSRLAQARDVLRLVRRGDDGAREVRAAVDAARGVGVGFTRSAPLILVMLQGAVRERRRVLLGYVDQQGTPRDRIVRPTAVDGGWLSAWDEISAASRRFALHRVTGVAEVDDTFGVPSVGGATQR